MTKSKLLFSGLYVLTAVAIAGYSAYNLFPFLELMYLRFG